MFYFRNSPPAQLSEVDPEQLESVNEFRKEVAESGVLYWMYKSPSDFETLARQHLSRQVQEWGKSWGGVVKEAEAWQAKKELPKDDKQPVGDSLGDARSITAIVFEQMAHVDKLRQRRHHDPEVIHRSFLEAQVILDSSPENDDWGQIAAQQAAALVMVALACRLESSDSAKAYVANVCNCVLGLRGLRIDWDTQDANELFELAVAARDRHDDDVLIWVKERAMS
ncbi:MAG: hypothetical protein CMJ64_03115 [Planctomycetaceae bacterium]|nr:hypothetical protein [Planctomycetaceae bacterium]